MDGETTRKQTVTLPWGRATVEDEVAVEGTAGGERHVQVGVARLRERDGGEELLRFFYRSEGRTARGPLTLRPAELDELAGMLSQAPELRRLLRRLAGCR